MKIRNGFVSNSSSSSFLIKKYNLSRKQIDKIINHKDESRKIQKPEDYRHEWYEGYIPCEDGENWQIEEHENHIYGYTTMDNFDISWFLEHIGIEEDDISWGDYYGCWPDDDDVSFME